MGWAPGDLTRRVSERQQPHPPTWVAATSPEAISWAAAGGYSILMDPHATFSEIGAKYDRYVDELATHGHAAPLDTPMARRAEARGDLPSIDAVAARTPVRRAGTRGQWCLLGGSSDAHQHWR